MSCNLDTIVLLTKKLLTGNWWHKIVHSHTNGRETMTLTHKFTFKFLCWTKQGDVCVCIINTRQSYLLSTASKTEFKFDGKRTVNHSHNDIHLVYSIFIVRQATNVPIIIHAERWCIIISVFSRLTHIFAKNTRKETESYKLLCTARGVFVRGSRFHCISTSKFQEFNRNLFAFIYLWRTDVPHLQLKHTHILTHTKALTWKMKIRTIFFLLRAG